MLYTANTLYLKVKVHHYSSLATDSVFLAGGSINLSNYDDTLHGPSMFAVRAKIYGVLYNQASSIAFDETSSYWSVLKRS